MTVSFTTPTVELIAHTEIKDDKLSKYLDNPDNATDAELLTEFAGRACYQSFHRPRPETAHTADYLKRTLFDQKHFSIAEHASATFYLQGVSRSFLAELTRHRHLSFSVQSQRYVDESTANMVLPPAYEGQDDEIKHLTQSVENALVEYQALVESGLSKGLGRKQAREAARAALPNCAETKIVVTGNLRAWYEVTQRRTKPDADAEIQRVCREIQRQLAEHVSPVIFGQPE